MKPHFNRLATAITWALIACSIHASVPLRWTVETSRANVETFDAYHGETLDLDAALLSYGTPLSISGDARLFYQTNGMDSAWWSVPATIAATNHLRASFAPASDPGAQQLNCFLGVTGSIYRAAFRIRFRNSPGAEPAVLALPVQSIDFARVSTTNAPWVPIDNGVVDSIRVLDKLYFGEPAQQGVSGSLNQYLAYANGQLTMKAPSGQRVAILNTDNMYTCLDELVDTVEAMGSTQSSVSDSLSALITTQSVDHATIAAWETYWDGDDVRVTVTNYDSQVHMPSLYLEQNTNTTAGASPAYRVVWDERTRWDSFLAGYNAFTNTAINNFADRSWGVYESATGAYSPDNLLQVSQEQIMIANGLAYQKTITTGGCALWVLQATDPTTVTGVTSNGFFRITDGDGNSLFEIVKGDKRTVGATASSIVANNGMTITYNAVSENHPTLELTTDLTNGPWLDETECSSIATVTWTGSSGAWVANVALVGVQTRMFAKASYEIGGDTYIRNTAPLGFSRIYIDGTNYTVHVEMMNGKKVLVLQ